MTAQLLQSSVSHYPSEIIRICCYSSQKTFLIIIINVLVLLLLLLLSSLIIKVILSVVLLNIFVDRVMHFFLDKIKNKKNKPTKQTN